MKTTKTNTTKTNVAANSNIKRYAIKGYNSVIECAAHSFELAGGLVGKTPTMWNKASTEAKADMDAIFAELGI